MKYHIFVLSLSLVILGIGTTGCSAEDGNRTVKGKALDRKVFELETGTSIEDVRAELGKPRLEKDLSKERVLYYGLWQLVFDPGLRSRTRDYKAGYRARNDKFLDRKIKSLQLGTSIKSVRAKLGTPEALELLRNAPHKEESLWYRNGRWKLSFADRALIRKSKFS